MKYQKTDWKNTVYDEEGNVLQKGTPLVASNMGKIEDGIVKNENRLDEMGEVAKKNHTHQEFVDYENRFNTLEQGMDGLHTHNNKSILDKITYSGAKQIIDLILLDELENHTHHANKIQTNADYRFTNDTEKAKWNKASDDIGDITTLDTVDKSSLVGAMNELFTNVSSGKSLVGGAITGVDDSVVIPTDPTFQNLADAIGSISTGKKWASGSRGFTSSRYNNISVNNLNFTPNLVVFMYAPRDIEEMNVVHAIVRSPYDVFKTGVYVTPTNFVFLSKGFSFTGTYLYGHVWYAFE